jgi:hypothetical protein
MDLDIKINIDEAKISKAIDKQLGIKHKAERKAAPKKFKRVVKDEGYLPTGKVVNSSYVAAGCMKCPLRMFGDDHTDKRLDGVGNKLSKHVVVFGDPNMKAFKSGNMLDDPKVVEFIKQVNNVAEQFGQPLSIGVEDNRIVSDLLYLTYYVKCCTGDGGMSSRVANCCRRALEDEFETMNIKTMLLIGGEFIKAAYGEGLLRINDHSCCIENGVAIFSTYNPLVMRKNNDFQIPFGNKLVQWFVCINNNEFVNNLGQ